MRAFLTGDDIFAHILLMRNVESKAYLVVEGPTDCAVLDPHIDTAHCASIPASGKSTVIRAMEIVHSTGIANVVGIVDSDLEELIGEPTNVANIFFTDLYDMEAVAILDDNVFSRIVSAYYDRDSVRSFEAGIGRSLRQTMVDIAFVVSYVRYVSARDNLGLKIRDFPIHLVLTADARVDAEAFSQICISRSKGSSVDTRDLLTILTSAATPPGIEVERMCCGHDLVAALFAIGSRFLGAAGSTDHLHRVVRAALDCATFVATRLARELDAWGRSRGLSVWKCA